MVRWPLAKKLTLGAPVWASSLRPCWQWFFLFNLNDSNHHLRRQAQMRTLPQSFDGVPCLWRPTAQPGFFHCLAHAQLGFPTACASFVLCDWHEWCRIHLASISSCSHGTQLVGLSSWSGRPSLSQSNATYTEAGSRGSQLKLQSAIETLLFAGSASCEPRPWPSCKCWGC